MHLKQLKLAGFKSFVDPTLIPFPSQLVAVVGPNGCGKSNIIDAVRWVMGESSAKSLRGESMTDVIFNGSSQRKALGQASIELVFDNSLGRLTGQYASYQEIAVKRLVTRDGESSYYLNGVRCRRRDITDIFLGTGAGTRGYSIIGQGTISRIVEARPEELRAYLEEAAGVSKYKERRRETLLRIEHTRENLARVADIRDELDKQLQRLERQAKAAERYKILKAEERLCKAEILALKWQALTEEQKTKQNELKRLLLDYESHQAKATEAYKQSTELREKLHEANEVFQQIQASFYQLATDIARLEESIQQQQREKKRLKDDQQQMQSDWQNASSQLQQDQESLAATESVLASLESNLQNLQTEFNLKQQTLREKQEQQTNWNQKNQQIQSALAKASQEVKVEQLSLQHLGERRQQILSRLEKINEELTLTELDAMTEALTIQQNTLVILQTKAEVAEGNYQQMIATAGILREQLADTEKQLHQAQDKVHHLNTQQASLLAAQRAALGKETNASQKMALWANKPRLVEIIRVEKEWRFACELVLGEGLQAIVMNELDSLQSEIKNLQGTAALFLSDSPGIENKKAFPRLSDKINGFKPSWIHSLDKIYTASSLEEACQCLPQLSAEESVITAEGYWLGKGWIKIAGSTTEDEQSLFLRQEELTKVKTTLAIAQEELDNLVVKRDLLHKQVKDKELELELSKQSLLTSRDEMRACEAEINLKAGSLRQAETRKETLLVENEELQFNLEDLASHQVNAEQNIDSQAQNLKKYEEELNHLTQEKITWEDSLQKSQQNLDEARAALHHHQLQTDRERLKIQQFHDNLRREQIRMETLNDRLESLANRLLELEAPDLNLNESLHEKILQHSQFESELSLKKEELNHLTREYDSLELLVRAEDKEAKSIQDKVQQEQMQEQALAVRAGGILEALEELDVQVDDLIATIPPGVTPNLREQELQDIVDKIKRLGAINLAAIEEYETEFQRKYHLDEQYQDLADALATLDTAIEKMDKETQQRLRSTFDEVNAAFQVLFPRLFGGGRAMLELTCDNLLEAGVLVMAQPPGKRNSTIHLLSGGEKAMTAVALVFAIFQLNPSPFCMLDEVDAPLDDVNVKRFCDLVKEMSQFVQFLFITHNKITMELADHLIGVTMREPGVSRIVAVDVEEALSMSEINN